MRQIVIQCIACVLLGVSGVTARDAVGPLFRQAPESNPARAARPEVVRERVVSIDQAMLDRVSSPGTEVMLNLFADWSETVSIDWVDRRGDEHVVCGGAMPKKPGGTFVLSRIRQAVYAEMWLAGDGMVRVRSLGAGLHVIEHVDPQLWSTCGGGVETPAAVRNGPILEHVGGDEGTVVDILIVYTAQAVAGAGGVDSLHGVLDVMIEQTNLAFVQSDIDMHVRLVHTALVDYQESGESLTDIVRLRQTNDGYMDEVHGLRNEVGADLVALVVNDFDACGRGYVGVGNAAYAFSTTKWTCGAATFAHEVGHNLGCHHDRPNACSSQSCTSVCCSANPSQRLGEGHYSYSYGYRFNGNSGQQWRTIMSYWPGTRIFNYSNPDILHDGQPTGIDSGDVASANNALTLNNTAAVVANYRTSICADSEEHCADGIDSDCDGLTDCEDADCATSVPCVPISIVASLPPHGAIDAGQPMTIDGTTEFGWSSVKLEFDGPADELTPKDFTLALEPPGPAPTLSSVDTMDHAALLELDDGAGAAFPPGHWLVITHDASRTHVRLGYLPGDVNGDRTASPNDIIALIDSLNGTGAPLDEWQTDIDRSGAANAADILRLIDLLNGAGQYRAWNGRALPD